MIFMIKLHDSDETIRKKSKMAGIKYNGEIAKIVIN